MTVGQTIARKAKAANNTINRFFGRATEYPPLRNEQRLDHATGSAEQAARRLGKSYEH
jgi:hypothetical protein